MPEVQMPRLSDTMEEGVLSQWLKSEGDQVRVGDVLGEIETDKATMELEAYDEGVLEKLLVPEGATVPIGQPIAVIRAPGEAAAPSAPAESGPSESAPAESAPSEPAAAEPSPARPAATAAPASTAEPVTGPGSAPAAQAAPTAETPAAPATGNAAAPPREIRTSPLARRIAREHGIDIATVKGTGPGGRIVRADVEAAAEAARRRQAEAAPAAPAAAATAPAAAPRAIASDDVEEIPLTNVRRVTARRMTESAAVPHVYLTSVVNVQPLLDFRAEVNERLASTGVKVSVNDLVVRACATTLKQHPEVNASWAEDKILRHRRIHIGVAVALEDGLIVPVIRDADRKSLGEIAAEARDLATRARNRKLTPDEFSGGTFSVSNLGMYGTDHFTAILNPPEAAILAVGAATEQPVVRDGQVVPGVTMKLTLSIDHRVLDGAVGAEFLRDLKAVLEEPLRIVV